ncbi:hypothetical protein MPC4_70024 [Methylocella tundrae]|uniref:Uncharacterized protein n=1 Tax=Methylocella tundrae TaxID=227605 RepID=A0A8B6MAS8_METTU|nr:hypothetical protein MPC4_70024 [Methylocella tundrae]
MKRAGAMRLDRREMGGRRIAGVPAEAVDGVDGAEPAHQPVARDLGDDGGGGDGENGAVALDDRLGLAAKPRREVVAVDQHIARRACESRQSPAHGAERRLTDIDRVDLRGAGKADRDRERARHDRFIEAFPLLRRQKLRIIEAARKIVRIKDHRRRRDRAGQWPAPRLVNARDRPDITLQEFPLHAEIGLFHASVS